ncbi:hypothetical protein GW17_00048884 [Ensete ventricosum]|nr:hypothetical protein GW17_00048884 [Ensete ventricosum]
MLNNGTFSLPIAIEQRELLKWSRKTHANLAMEVERDVSVCKAIMPSTRGGGGSVADSFWILLLTSCTIADIMTSREEKGEPEVQCCSPNLDPSPADDFFSRVGRRNVSPRGEIKRESYSARIDRPVRTGVPIFYQYWYGTDTGRRRKSTIDDRNRPSILVLPPSSDRSTYRYVPGGTGLTAQ